MSFCYVLQRNAPQTQLQLQVSASGPVNDQLMTSAILRTAYDLLLCSTFHEFAFVVET